MKLSDYLRLSGKNFRRNGYKTVLPIIIITIGIVLFNILSGFFASMTTSTKESVTDNNSLRYISVSSLDSHLSQKDFEKMRKLEGVLTSFPDVRKNIWIDYKGESKSTELIGVNSEAVPYFTSGKEKSIQGNEIILSSAYAKLFKIGSNLIQHQVTLNDKEVMLKEKPAKIRSFYDPFYLQAYPSEIDPISLASIEFVEQLNAEAEKLTLAAYRKKHLSSCGVVIAKSVEDVPVIGEKLDKMGYSTSYALKSADQIPMAVKVMGIIGGIVVLTLLLSSGVSIASIIGNSLRGRYKEIGVLRALGFERAHLIKLFSIEVLYIAFLSFVLSVVTSWVFMKVIEYMVNQQFMKGNSYTFVLAMDVNKVLLSLLLILVVSLLSSIRPILKASSVNITEIIRGNST